MEVGDFLSHPRPHKTNGRRIPMDMDRARALLEAERDRLRSIIDAATQTSFGQAEVERGSELLSHDSQPADAPQELYEAEQEQSFVERAEADLREVEHAMAKLADGTYGLDEATGEPIPDERLEARPATRFTVENQKIDEKRAGLPGGRSEADPTATAGGGGRSSR